MTKVLVTGATGFVGGALVKAINRAQQHNSLIALRTLQNYQDTGPYCIVGEYTATTDWSDALSDRQVVIHAAARVHTINEKVADPLKAFRTVNVDATLNLATQAARAGVGRFIFVSSVKVNGEYTTVGSAFKSSDEPCPQDPYAISKYEAEVGLRQIAKGTGMEVVVVRPPMVYGPKAKGNFSSMLTWLQRGIPLPLGAITENRRSLVALDNLVDLLLTCIDHPAAANETFLVSDGEDLSTANMLSRIGLAMGKATRLFSVPPALLFAAANLLSKRDMAQRLLGNLQVDISHTCQTLGWEPPIGVDEGLRIALQGLSK